MGKGALHDYHRGRNSNQDIQVPANETVAAGAPSSRGINEEDFNKLKERVDTLSNFVPASSAPAQDSQQNINTASSPGIISKESLGELKEFFVDTLSNYAPASPALDQGMLNDFLKNITALQINALQPGTSIAQDPCVTKLELLKSKTNFAGIFAEQASALTKMQKAAVIEAIELLFRLAKQSLAVRGDFKFHDTLGAYENDAENTDAYYIALGSYSNRYLNEPLEQLQKGIREYVGDFLSLTDAKNKPYIQNKAIKAIKAQMKQQAWEDVDTRAQIEEYCSGYCVYKLTLEGSGEDIDQIAATGICALHYVYAENL